MLEDRRQKAEVRRQRTKGTLFYFLIFVLAMLIFTGCAAQMKKEARVCPGKKSIDESLSSLRVRSENATPLKADGQCLLQYYDAEGKPKRENFPVKLWVNPPVEIYMQGDVAFDPKGVAVGSNKDEFWLAVKLKEVSSFWWGRWSEKEYPEKLLISPKLVLESLGAAAVGDEQEWALSNEGAFDVLTKQDDGIETKKIYINNCDYLVRKIEYFGGNGRAAIIVELDKYKEISKNFFVPGVVRIVNLADGNKKNSAQITLSSVKSINFTAKQRGRLFVRPQPQGFKHIYKIVDGNIIEQSQ
jgi:hypothetical protein